MTAVAMILLAMAVAGCGSNASGASSNPSAGATSSVNPTPDVSALIAHLEAIDDAVNRWRSAPDIATAHAAAEEARNLVVGPSGPWYGDADGDGPIAGASAVGLLPGLNGEVGLATPSAGACVERDVLGGSWADPASRWAILETAIDGWSSNRNTFPALPSHPQRIVGWATLTLATSDVATARWYAGHANLHIDISLQAASACRG